MRSSTRQIVGQILRQTTDLQFRHFLVVDLDWVVDRSYGRNVRLHLLTERGTSDSIDWSASEIQDLLGQDLDRRRRDRGRGRGKGWAVL